MTLAAGAAEGEASEHISSLSFQLLLLAVDESDSRSQLDTSPGRTASASSYAGQPSSCHCTFENCRSISTCEENT
eukprot:CAMPEP_0170498886 /NCGR_PEP_ID=MMETSP0208-20121228/29360_1 /TAXON_ID=197538 /ORGANISM="Strombidium inclinatum, Strain S3" /LENGTH=74 /DNA_ID=CAMNT_0010776219 /DNA_START=2255 /DNA_END=2479 /DNA_ORIENTATION=-